MLKYAWQSLMELLYPYRCPVCNAIVEKQPQLCAQCQFIIDIRFVDARVVEGGHIDALIFVTHYKHIRHILHAAKFDNKPQAIQVLANAMADQWSTEHSAMLQDICCINLQDCCCVIVPTDYKRRLARGYDIPEMLFNQWMHRQHLEYLNILRRIKSTRPQFELNRKERQINVLNSVEVIGEVRGKNIILLDDIFTTGASVSEAARVLRLKGARSVVALAFASDMD